MTPLNVRWRTLAAAIGGAGGSIAALWLLIPPTYLTNDDVTIRLGTEALTAPGQPPTGFVLMTHAALGWAVVWLHRAFPGVPAWDLVLAASLVAAVGTCIAIAWTAAGSAWLRLSATAALVAGVAPLLIGVQFTISATLAGAAGLMLAAAELRLPTRARRGVLAFAAVQGAVGLLIRPMAATAGAVAAALFIAPLMLMDAERRRQHLPRLIVTGALAAVAGLAAVYTDSSAYRLAHQEWASYHRYNWIVGRLFEWGGDISNRQTDAVLTSAGWTLNDWRMLQAGWGVNPDLHGLPRLEAAYEQSRTAIGWSDSYDWLVRRVTQMTPASARSLTSDSATLWVVMAVLAAACANRRGLAAAGSALGLFVLFCAVTAVVFKDIPFRLLAPLQLTWLAAGVTTVMVRRRRTPPVLQLIALSLIATFAIREVHRTVTALENDRRHTAQVRAEIESVRALRPSLLVLHADAFPSEHWWQPFHQATQDLPTLQLGGNNQNPLVQRFLGATGRRSLLQALCSDPSILVVSEPGRLEFVTTYLAEHFGITASWTKVHDGSFRAWRCVAVHGEQPGSGNG